MSQEGKCQETDSARRQALDVLKALSHFEYPTDVAQVEDWLERTRPLQSLVKTLCRWDKTGVLATDCVDVLHELMAANGESVSPAIWDVLDVVDDEEVNFLVDCFLNDSTSKGHRLKKVLCALVYGACQCGERIPKVHAWCLAFVRALEEKQKYSVLLGLSQKVVSKILHGLILPHSRKLVFPLFERILYPMTYPHVFNMIVDEVPDLLSALGKDQDKDMKKIGESFCGLIRKLIERFPPSNGRMESYRKARVALSEYPDVGYKPPNYPLWCCNSKPTATLSSILECPVCYERFVTPIVVCENGHCICSNCKEQLVTCPICRAQFSKIRMTIIDQIMEITSFHCKNSDSGCDAKMPYKEISNHEIECEYRTVTCDIVTIRDSPKLFCNEDVVVAYFHEHIEERHKSFVTKFELNRARKGELRRGKTNEVRLLKNSASNLYFIERIYVTEEEIFFSYHYVGRSADAKNYIYTIKINGNGIPQKIRYSNFCLPNYMGVFDTEGDERCLILEPEKIFDSQQTKFEYTVKIENINAYRLRLRKNKFLGSN